MRTLRPAIVSLLIMGLPGCTTHEASKSSKDISPRPSETASTHSHEQNVERYIASLEQSDRDKWQKPEEVIQALNIKKGERIADVGCGPGYFTLRLAKAVGPTGTIWAVDIKQEMLNRLQEHLDKAHLNNVKMVLAPPDDPMLPVGQIDTILIANTYHHFADRSVYLVKLRQALAPDGRIAIIDFVPKDREERGFGPPKKEQLSRETVDAEMAKQGLHPVKVHDFLPEQYFVEYK